MDSYVGPSSSKSALIIVDIQNDFVTGPLAAGGTRDVIENVNLLREQCECEYDVVILTLDWHPLNHFSFAVNNPGTEPFQSIISATSSPGAKEAATQRTVWPIHCVQFSQGAALEPSLIRKPSDVHITKGDGVNEEGYSAFDNPELHRVLQSRGCTKVTVVGIATDYCVRATAMDASRHGYEVRVVLDCCAGVTPKGVEAAIAEMRSNGAKILPTLHDLFEDIRSSCDSAV
eukprot:GHVU01110279.1.p1 GENE.GHVU01110279.1~~GHVU01110279.1.p1  ORF type:complete len:231 (+),score=26.58 GHVU01110279.1:1683-2375(+)